jgi:hypothetical protein
VRENLELLPRFVGKTALSRTLFRPLLRPSGKPTEQTVLLRDHMGVCVSSSRRSSIDRYMAALHALHAPTGNLLGVNDVALAEELDFIAGHVSRAALMLSGSDKCAVPELQRSLEAAEALITSGRSNDRERSHIAAARAWLDKDFQRATDRYNRLALEYPRDGLAVRIAHACNF